MIENQLSRRNLSPNEASLYRGLAYRMAEKRQGERTDRTSGHFVRKLPAAERIARQHGVTERTVRRDEQFADAVDRITEVAGETARHAILRRNDAIPQTEVFELSKMAAHDPELVKRILADPRIGKGRVRGIAKLYRRQAQAETIAKEPPPLPSGPFRVIVADPPWCFDVRANDPLTRGVPAYPMMDTDAICALPVNGLAHDDAILWLWTTNTHLVAGDALRVVKAWGFEPKTMLTWVKPHFGNGEWLRGQTEHCILATRGHPTHTLSNQSTVLQAPKSRHSEKPDAFYALVESMCPGSKVDLFARKARAGWSVWGAEVPSRKRRKGVA